MFFDQHKSESISAETAGFLDGTIKMVVETKKNNEGIYSGRSS